MKHPYATNLAERRHLPLFVAGAALLGALALGRVWQLIGWTPPAWLDVPSTVGLYGLGYKYLSDRAWKWRVLRNPGFVRTPDLAGVWKGKVRTSFDDHATSHPVTVTIRQNWTEISISLKSDSSESKSEIASLLVGDETILTYDYCNEPRPGAPATMHAHRGTGRLILSTDGTTLSGQYYSGRDRQNCGTIDLKLQ
jgi:hypothetical protein